MQASVDNSIRCLSSLLTNFERLVCRHTAERRRIHNLSSNLAILPTEIIQAILIAGMTPDDTNTDYLRAITQTSRQLRDAALGCSDLWVNLSLAWGEQQFRVWRNRLQGRPAELPVTPSLLRRWVFHFGDLRRLELST